MLSVRNEVRYLCRIILKTIEEKDFAVDTQVFSC